MFVDLTLVPEGRISSKDLLQEKLTTSEPFTTIESTLLVVVEDEFPALDWEIFLLMILGVDNYLPTRLKEISRINNIATMKIGLLKGNIHYGSYHLSLQKVSTGR